MTPVKRRVVRETAALVRDRHKIRPVVLILAPPGDRIGFRAKGTRKTYFLPIHQCYILAVQAHADAMRAARKSHKRSR